MFKMKHVGVEKKISMRKLFLVWLTVFVILTFIFSSSLSFFLQTRLAYRSAIQLINLKIKDAKKQISVNMDNFERMKKIVDEDSLAKARAYAGMIEMNPAIINDVARLKGICKSLGVDELHVSDEKGILISSIPEEFRGYDMNSKEQSKAFMPAITNPEFELSQTVQAKGINGKLFKYSGVARRDKPGIVQIGYVPIRLNDSAKVTNIKNLAGGLRIGNGGHITICNLDGTILSSVDIGRIGNSISRYGIDLYKIYNKKGKFETIIDDTPTFCVFEKYQGYCILGFLPETEMYFDRNVMIRDFIFLYVIIFITVFVLVSLLVQRMVINGIRRVNVSLAKITNGDLNEKVNEHSTNEFLELSNGINETVDALKAAIAEAAARIDKELETARAIQTSALPDATAPFPNHKEFSISAKMLTAKEVGGDFYDFFLVDETHLGIVIADVSGKGVPASLFMMQAKTAIKDKMTADRPLCEIIADVNNTLCENNGAGMFVTAFIGLLDIKTGQFSSVNAGHNPPLLKKANGQFEWFKHKGGLILAAMEGSPYHQMNIVLHPGDRIYLYTDGVSEAFNPQGQLFGEERLISALNNCIDKNYSGKDLIEYLKNEIENFRLDAPQSDDITMLILDYLGNN